MTASPVAAASLLRSPKQTDVGDLTLLSSIRAGDEEAFDLLTQRYWTSLVRYALTIEPNQDAAEDLVQESLIRLWTRRGSLTLRGSVRAYLYTTVRNLALNERARRKVHDSWAAQQRSPVGHSSTPFDDLQQTDVLVALQNAIDALPERRREVFTLACLRGLSYAEVANVMGIAVATVANQMSAALNTLREVLDRVTDVRI